MRKVAMVPAGAAILALGGWGGMHWAARPAAAPPSCTTGWYGVNVEVRVSGPAAPGRLCAEDRYLGATAWGGGASYRLPALAGEPVACEVRWHGYTIRVEDTGGQILGQDVCVGLGGGLR